VQIDGESIGVCGEYTFTDVQENHTITVVSEANLPANNGENPNNIQPTPPPFKTVMPTPTASPSLNQKVINPLNFGYANVFWVTLVIVCLGSIIVYSGSQKKGDTPRDDASILFKKRGKKGTDKLHRLFKKRSSKGTDKLHRLFKKRSSKGTDKQQDKLNRLFKKRKRE
jgi:hypothetical protein